MKTQKSFLPGLIIAVALVVSGINGSFADNPKLCAPFKNSEVDQTVVAMLLDAAEKGGLYRIESSTSNLAFGVNSVIGHIEARFTDFQGGISLKEKTPIKQGPALVRIGTDSLKTDGFLVRQLLKGNQFFNVEKYPAVYFVSKNLRWVSPHEGILEGELTLRGITRQVSFHVDLANADVTSIENADIIKMKATTTIQRSDYGMDAFPSLADNTVDLSIQVSASRYSF